MSKQKGPKQQQSSRYSFDVLEKRPVTNHDDWCHIPIHRRGKPVFPSDWGYVVIIPNLPKENVLLEGFEDFCIVRCKKDGNRFLLQVVRSRYPMSRKYGIGSYPIPVPRDSKKTHSKKKLCRIWNIRNLSKGNAEF